MVRTNLRKKELQKAIELCTWNAQRFINDARLLMKARSYGHALSLAILAVEETGKKMLLWQVYFGTLEVEVALSQDFFFSHPKKLVEVLKSSVQLISIRANREKMLKLVNGISRDLYEDKLEGLYVNIKAGLATSPRKVTCQKAKDVISFAESMVSLSTTPLGIILSKQR